MGLDGECIGRFRGAVNDLVASILDDEDNNSGSQAGTGRANCFLLLVVVVENLPCRYLLWVGVC